MGPPVPITARAALSDKGKAKGTKEKEADREKEKDTPPEAHHSLFLETLAAELKCKPEEIVDFELNVCDTQPGTVGTYASAVL
eukprot:7848305-Pyramimonas_sp.AAC.1